MKLLAWPARFELATYGFVESRFGAVPVDQIKAIDLETFKQELMGKGLSPASVKHILGNIRRVFNKLAEWELFDGRLPTASVKMPKVDNARVRHLTHEEAESLLAEIKNSSLTWWRISCISLNTGRHEIGRGAFFDKKTTLIFKAAFSMPDMGKTRSAWSL